MLCAWMLCEAQSAEKVLLLLVAKLATLVCRHITGTMEQAVVICTFHGCKRRSDGGSQGYSDLHHFKPQPSARLDPTTTPTVQAIALPTQPAPSYLPDWACCHTHTLQPQNCLNKQTTHDSLRAIKAALSSLRKLLEPGTGTFVHSSRW